MIRFSTGVDLITAAVRAAVGDPVQEIKQRADNDHWAELILHADKDGIFEKLEIMPGFEKYVVETDLWVKPGDKVSSFKGANETIGTLILRFETRENMETFLFRPWEYLTIQVL